MKPRIRLHVDPTVVTVSIGHRQTKAHLLQMGAWKLLPNGEVGSYQSIEKAAKSAIKALRGRGVSERYMERFRDRPEY